MVSRIQISKPDIVLYFDSNPQKVFDRSDINAIFDKNRRSWRLTQSMTSSEFINYLVRNTKLRSRKFNFPYRPIIKYTWGKVPFYQLLLALKSNAYFTHFTAMYFHELTDQIPKVIYVNVEQKLKARRQAKLDQKNIDAAFAKPTRLSKNFAEYKKHKIQLLNGMYTGNIGIVDITGGEGEPLRLTDVERTLIDIAVRPEYAGGPFEVLKAYRRAKEKVSINRLTATIKKINYIYPYHQVIGFYLERTGVYKQSQLDLLRKFEKEYDFYLMHQMKEKEYSHKWRLYFPKGLGK